jgi:hypothetical protein
LACTQNEDEAVEFCRMKSGLKLTRRTQEVVWACNLLKELKQALAFYLIEYASGGKTTILETLFFHLCAL